MTHARGVRALATAVLLLVAVTSCSDGVNDPAASGSATPSSPAATSSSPTPTPPSDTQVASDSASALVRQFYAVRNELRQDPRKPLSRLKTVAISTELSAQQNLFRRERRDGLHQTGETKIAELKVQSVNLDNSDPQVGKVPTVQVDVCFDVSEVDILDAEGESIVSPDRPDTGWIRYSVANYEWDSNPDGGWRVASSQDIELAPCAVL